jgi:hypothetical protein
MPLDWFQLLTIVVSVATFLVIAWVKNDRARPWRYSLGTLLFAMTLIAVVIGLVSALSRWPK